MSQQSKFLFNKKKYIVLFTAIIILILGFLLMSGGGTNGTEFKPEIFSNRRIVFAPILIIIAFIMCGYSIMMKK
ncbi:MAG: DUF3098 domain-containing protein [Bacteroidota bacterium]|nr:DUF3098 domain-containing protein [Bacteroidota bacterium]